MMYVCIANKSDKIVLSYYLAKILFTQRQLNACSKFEDGTKFYHEIFLAYSQNIPLRGQAGAVWTIFASILTAYNSQTHVIQIAEQKRFIFFATQKPFGTSATFDLWTNTIWQHTKPLAEPTVMCSNPNLPTDVSRQIFYDTAVGNRTGKLSPC